MSLKAILIGLLLLPSTLVFANTLETGEPSTPGYEKAEEAKACIDQYAFTIASHYNQPANQIAEAALGYCDNKIESFRQYNREMSVANIPQNDLRELSLRGAALYAADQQFHDLKLSWIKDIEYKILKHRNATQ
ncbi:hypothetical protein AB7W88_15280 [Providencia vermicola]|uniref:DUF1311 domain-containing protein n=2 Tax=Providencia TaxID=586 RepID=A0AAI9I404_PROST|nr:MULTISPECIES: hypothetical protein [Providencia]ELR5044762.1 hypothetical protein [Providencia rettgeri]ELR5034851.1 hypothetical protein [Providencia stuartii]ELR5037923.1 hypothetical protein [Providencia stuartii]ELR5122264.1 hypothetical protein [Providencia stuartii]ELR5142698.1 hypothetical protein [Providencia stuartii]